MATCIRKSKSFSDFYPSQIVLGLKSTFYDLPTRFIGIDMELIDTRVLWNVSIHSILLINIVFVVKYLNTLIHVECCFCISLSITKKFIEVPMYFTPLASLSQDFNILQFYFFKSILQISNLYPSIQQIRTFVSFFL